LTYQIFGIPNSQIETKHIFNICDMIISLRWC
jgi:hypothetical protein